MLFDASAALHQCVLLLEVLLKIKIAEVRGENVD